MMVDMTSQSAPSSIPLGARVVLMRHGETEWARTGKHTGRTEVPLTPLGEMQAPRPEIACEPSTSGTP